MVLLKVLLFLSILYSYSYAIEIKNIHHAVDVAGKQRMFTQKMLKDYTMIGMENNFNNQPTNDLKDIISKFQNHLESLHNYTHKKEIIESTNRVKKLWIPIKKILLKTPKKEYTLKLQADLEELLKASDTTTHLFAKETGERSGVIIDISGRQRMLSQRMASLYMLKVWGIKNKDFKNKMDITMNLFETSLETLKQSKLNTKEINDLLKEVEKSFSFFKIMNKTSNTFIPTLIYKKSNDILKNMNIITHKYVVLKSKQEQFICKIN